MYTGGGINYDSGPYTVTFPAGITYASFNVSIANDGILEYDKEFKLIIDSSSLPIDVTVSNPSEAVVTIVDSK